MLHHLAVAFDVDARLVREDAGDLAIGQPAQHPFRESIVIALVLHHDVEGEDSRAVGGASLLAGVLVVVGQAQHVARFVDDGLRGPRLVARIRQRHGVP